MGEVTSRRSLKTGFDIAGDRKLWAVKYRQLSGSDMSLVTEVVG